MAKGISDLEEIKQAFRTIYGTIKQSPTTKQETALITWAGNNNFKKKFKVDCRTCGKKGHKSSNCWETPGNKDNCPSKWKSTNNSEAAHSTTSNKSSKYHCDYCDKDGHSETVIRRNAT
jgi:hypothetical protein